MTREDIVSRAFGLYRLRPGHTLKGRFLARKY
jgi:hypothetical protein